MRRSMGNILIPLIANFSCSYQGREIRKYFEQETAN